MAGVGPDRGVAAMGALDSLRGLFARRPEPPREIAGETLFADPYRLYSLYGATPYNPSELVARKGIGIFTKMRRDEQVKAALGFKKLAALAAGWEVVSPDGEAPDWEVTRFVADQIAGVEGSAHRALKDILLALDYGYSVTEKVFGTVESGEWQGHVGLLALKTRHPRGFLFHTNLHGNLERVEQDATPRNIEVPREKVVIWSYQMEFGNWYGCSDLEAAYRAWWSKDNAYRWLNMLLERYGVPPMFAQYNPQKYNTTQINDLFTNLKRLQAATSGVIPRPSKDDLDFYTPQLAREGAQTFRLALQQFDLDIARGLLVPTLIGVTPDESTGSLARSQQHFDAFLMVIDELQRLVADEAVNDQIVRQLVDLNFATGGVYPQFRFREIDKEVRADLLTAWGTLTGMAVVRSGADDEDHIRKMMGFPPAAENAEAGPEDDPTVEPGDDPALTDMRQHSADPTARVDFQAVGAEMDDAEVEARATLSRALASARDDWMAALRRDFPDEPEEIAALKPPPLDAFSAAVGDMLAGGFAMGRDQVKRELPRLFRVDPFNPTDALRFTRAKRFWITGLVEKDMLEQSRGVLIAALQSGAGVDQTMRQLRGLFESLVGDGSLPPALGTAPRLETIVRTNLTDAMNAGRVAQARTLGNLLRGFRYSAILDARTTEVCRYLHGKEMAADDPAVDQLRPPRHYNCRSVLVPIVVGDKVKGFMTPGETEKALDLSGAGFAPLGTAPAGPGPLSPLASANEAEAWLSRKQTQLVPDFGGLDDFTARQVAEATADALDDAPMVRPRFVGTGEAKATGLPEYPRWAAPNQEALTSWSADGGIFLNPKRLGVPDAVTDWRVGSGLPAAVVRHEVGHQVRFALAAVPDVEAVVIKWAGRRNLPAASMISGLSTTGLDEWLAEAFTAARYGVGSVRRRTEVRVVSAVIAALERVKGGEAAAEVAADLERELSP